jgi:hypothetical protein
MTNHPNRSKQVIYFAYRLGESVEVREVNFNNWRKAIIVKLAPYRGKPGYYIQWSPLCRRKAENRAVGGHTKPACGKLTRLPRV